MKGTTMRYSCLVILVFLWLGCCGLAWTASSAGPDKGDDATTIKVSIPTLNTDNGNVNAAFRIGVGDLLGNVGPFKDGLLEKPVPVILAGLDYNTP